MAGSDYHAARQNADFERMEIPFDILSAAWVWRDRVGLLDMTIRFEWNPQKAKRNARNMHQLP